MSYDPENHCPECNGFKPRTSKLCARCRKAINHLAVLDHNKEREIQRTVEAILNIGKHTT